MAYTKQTWADLPTKTSPFTAARMNHIEDGISNNDTNKLDKTSVKTSKTTSSSDTYSCTYINGIVESGSNSNGSWVKFIDGTMICRFTQEITVNIATSWGSLYGSRCTVHDYPQTFIEVPDVSITLLARSYAGFVSVNGYTDDTAASTTNPGSFGILRATTAYGNYKVSVIAIGKWK